MNKLIIQCENLNLNRWRYDKIISILGVLMLIMAFMLLIPKADALGITPGRTTLDYEAGAERDIAFSIVNNEHKNMQVLLMVQGELNESITFYENMIEFLPSEESKSLRYKIKLPDKISKQAGLHTAEIVAMEIPRANAQGTYVGATIAVISQVHVNVPCPGKCIESDLNVLDAEQNSTATFIVPVINRGQLGIGNARAIIDIYTSLNEKIITIETDTWPIDAGKRTELSGKWQVDVPSGSYLAKVTVFYDGESKSFEKQFSVGTQTLSLESILVNDFTLGEIAKLQILVENRWNQELKDVYANLLVYNHESQVMADVKSSSESVPALTKKELIAYWDTVGVKEGEYNGKLMVKYGQKSADKNLILEITEDSLNIVGLGFAITPKPGGISITTILFVLVIILLIANLSWFIFFRKFLSKRTKGKGTGLIKVHN